MIRKAGHVIYNPIQRFTLRSRRDVTEALILYKRERLVDGHP